MLSDKKARKFSFSIYIHNHTGNLSKEITQENKIKRKILERKMRSCHYSQQTLTSMKKILISEFRKSYRIQVQYTVLVQNRPLPKMCHFG